MPIPWGNQLEGYWKKHITPNGWTTLINMFFVTISGLLKWQQKCSTLEWSSSNCTKRFASYMWGKVCAWENTQTPLHMDMHFKALGLTGIINPAGSWSQRPMLLVYKKMSHRKKTKQTTSIRILVKGVRFLLTFVSTRFWLMCAMIFAATVPWRVCVCMCMCVRALCWFVVHLLNVKQDMRACWSPIRIQSTLLAYILGRGCNEMDERWLAEQLTIRTSLMCF